MSHIAIHTGYNNILLQKVYPVRITVQNTSKDKISNYTNININTHTQTIYITMHIGEAIRLYSVLGRYVLHISPVLLAIQTDYVVPFNSLSRKTSRTHIPFIFLFPLQVQLFISLGTI